MQVLPIRCAAGARPTDQLSRIYYFSAVPDQCELPTQQRHALYMGALRGTGVNVQLARFKRKDIRCKKCWQLFSGYEEKETDVAIAARLFELCQTDEADTVVLMTGDTDLAPAARTCNRLFPEHHILFAFPYRRLNDELREIAPTSFTVKLKTCLSHQFPDPLVLADGTQLHKPPKW